MQCLLVVEDDILVRFQICDYLRECGFRVIEAANAEEAILILEKLTVPVDLVLSATEIAGGMDGFSLAQWVRRERPGLPVILCGSPGKAVDTAADLCESGPMLAKPYEPQLLLDRIRRNLAERKPPGGSE
jgi:DNA-binding response OmpR family regulator